jgi:cephalosporin hydroxylase
MRRQTLDALARKFGTDKSSAQHAYAPVYDAWLSPLRDAPITLIEIGVAGGKSIQMWDEYFTHPKAKIFGMDVMLPQEARAKIYSPRVHFFYGDQGDPVDLARLDDALLSVAEGHADIIIDDGCHLARAQQFTFTTLFPLLNPGGQYWIEDLETSLRPTFNDAPQTTLKFLQGFAETVRMGNRDARAVHFWMQLCLVVKGP